MVIAFILFASRRRPFRKTNPPASRRRTYFVSRSSCYPPSLFSFVFVAAVHRVSQEEIQIHPSSTENADTKKLLKYYGREVYL